MFSWPAVPRPVDHARRLLLSRLKLGALLALFLPRQQAFSQAIASPVFGRYRGVVVNNQDPLGTARVQLKVPAVLGETISGWALPSLPLAGMQTAIYALPQVGDSVWVEFEAGDPNRPIYVGGFWNNSSQLPPEVLAAPNSVVLDSSGHCRLILCDTSNSGITLETPGGTRIAISDGSIVLSTGQGAILELSGDSVLLNGEKLK